MTEMMTAMRIRILSTALLIALAYLPCHATAQQNPAHTFEVRSEQFLLDGKPFQIVSGEMHYPRVPRQYWRDRMRMMKAMGLNTLTTYVFWDLHEPKPGQFDFSGNLDVAAFVRMAQEEGLWVIVRPGPYICTEWDFGGLPAWLLADPNIRVRTTDPRFLSPAERYMRRVGQELARLQIDHGGPIIMVQVENEYGSFGNDHDYMQSVRQMIARSGFDVTLYTADGANRLAAGTVPDLPAAINFGATDSPAKEFALFDSFRRGVPRMCGEFWVGWFDAWGQKHHTVAAAKAAEGLDWMLAHGISVSLYMFHGGTTFGFMPGANKSETYTPDITSYDYDSPLDEAGRPTPKFFALREVIARYLPPETKLPPVPPPPSMITIPRFELAESATLASALPSPSPSEQVKTMEDMGQDYGLILYRTRLAGSGKGKLELEPKDYAVVLQGAKPLAVIDRGLNQTSADVEWSGSEPLDILVENMGRINFGRFMVNDRKGLAAPVRLAGKELTGWEIFPLPLNDLSRLKFSRGAKAGPAFYRGAFELRKTGDTYLDLRGWGKGYVWVNGHNLGRFWNIGPQQTLFVPSGWMRTGANEIIVLDFEPGRNRSVAGIEQLVFETPIPRP